MLHPSAAEFAHKNSPGAEFQVPGAVVVVTVMSGRQRVDARASTGCRVSIYAFICFLTHSVETDFGRVMAVPRARLSTNWASTPMDRETAKSTV